MESRSLEGESSGRIFAAFMEAFADCAVPVTWDLEGFLANNARRYVLEVLRDNLAAVKTCERAGFRVTRLFECPGGDFAGPVPRLPAGVAFTD